MKKGIFKKKKGFKTLIIITSCTHFFMAILKKSITFYGIAFTTFLLHWQIKQEL